jgi:hypothetical protein
VAAHGRLGAARNAADQSSRLTGDLRYWAALPRRAERVLHVPDFLDHRSLRIPVEQWAETVREHSLGACNTHRAHRILALEPLCQSKDRVSSTPHCSRLDHNRRDNSMSRPVVGVLDDIAKAARDLPAGARLGELAGAQRQWRCRPIRTPGGNLAVECRASEIHPDTKSESVLRARWAFTPHCLRSAP